MKNFIPIKTGTGTVHVSTFHETVESWWRHILPPFQWLIPSDLKKMPVTGKSPNQIIEYINRLNKKSIYQYRLLTIHEWNVIINGIYRSNDILTDNDIYNQFWVAENCKGRIQQTGLKKPSSAHIYDALGNVWDLVTSYHSDDDFFYVGGSIQSSLNDLQRIEKFRTLESTHAIDYRLTGFRLVINNIIENNNYFLQPGICYA